MRTNRLRRLLNLITALHTGRSLTVEDLSKELRVTRRTIFRDLEILQHSGVPFKYDRREMRYRVDREYFIPPISFTMDEAMAMLFVLRRLIRRSLLPDFPAAQEAAMKIESGLPPELMDYCGSMLESMEAILPPHSDSEAVGDIFSVLRLAIIDHRKVRIQYEPPVQPVEELWLHPYRLDFIHRAWYVIGFSEIHQQIRTFKLERISRYEMGEATFTLLKPFRLTEYLGNAWTLIRGEQRYTVKILFSNTVATNVEEVLWHKTQRVTRRDDGLLFEVDVDGLKEISWWIMGYGDQALVLEPPELREIIIHRVRSMNDQYEQNPERMMKSIDPQVSGD